MNGERPGFISICAESSMGSSKLKREESLNSQELLTGKVYEASLMTAVKMEMVSLRTNCECQGPSVKVSTSHHSLLIIRTSEKECKLICVNLLKRRKKTQNVRAQKRPGESENKVIQLFELKNKILSILKN